MRALLAGNRIIALLLGVAAFAASGWVLADPPTRVARVGFLAGNVSFSPAGENDWVQARLNRPLTTGDRLWTDRASRVELQVGGAVIRMGENASLTLLNLDDNVAQVQLDEGTLNVRVRQLAAGQSVEVATPNLAFTTRRVGSYRIEVDSMDDTTSVIVRNGQGEVYGERASYAVDSRQAYRFAGSGLRSYEYIATPRPDEFERWASDRDRRAESSASARYVSRDLIGYEDLDANGTWRSEPGYGNVWVPARVSADWTPYRDGHWAWIDPWGWTWVDDAPWGFAVSHYGRWANFRGRWAWVPGPARSRAVYAPALVAFVGGNNFQISISSGNVGGVAWFPLGPRDVYRPSYQASRGYFDNINRSNTTINNTTIINVYNNRNVSNVYANRQVQGAVVAVPKTAFVQSQAVSRAAVRLTRETAASAPVSIVAAVAPVQQSVRGGATAAASPPAGQRAREQRVIVRSAPPAARPGFAAQERELAAKPGTPLAPAASAALKPAARVAAPNVVVAAPAKSAAPNALPPASAPEGKPSAHDRRDARRADGERPREQVRGGKSDQASKDDQRAKPAATSPAPPQTAPSQPAAQPRPAPVQPQAMPAQAAPPSSAAPSRDDRGAKGERPRDRERGGKDDQGSKVGQTAQPAVPSVVPPPVAAAPPAAAAPAAAPAPPKPVLLPPQAAPAPSAPPAAQPQRDEKAAKGEHQRDRAQRETRDAGSKGERANAAATPPAAATPQPAPVTPRPEPAPVPVKPAPPPPPPVKPVPAPAPVPAPPRPEPAPAARQAPVAPPAAAPQSPPPKPRPDADKQDDRKSDKQQKREGAATKKGDEERAREQEEKKK